MAEPVETTCAEVTLREFGRALNSITSFLNYTFEKEEDFCDNMIPTLDCKIGVDTINNRYQHTY